MSDLRPPRLAVHLLGLLVPESCRGLEGDLAEEFRVRLGTGQTAATARRWYWGQVMRSAPALLGVQTRGALRTLFVLAFAALTPGATSAQTLEYQRVEIAPGVHLFEAPDQGAGHIVLVVSGSEGLVVDAGTSPIATEAVADAAYALGVRSLRGVVYTHWHMDHVLGTQSFLARFPGTPVLAHQEAGEMMRTEVAPDLARQITRIRERIEVWDAQLASGKTAAGEPLDASTRGAIEQRRPVFQDLLEGFEVVDLVYPTETFDGRLQLRVGSLTVELLRLGPAHSSTDIGVRVVEPGVLLPGDLVTLPYPAAGEGFSSIRGWQEALAHLLELEFDFVVPGHGPVQDDRSYLQDLSTLMSELVEQVDAAKARGDAPETIAEQVDVTWWIDRHLRDDPRLRAGFQALFLNPAVQILLNER